MKIFKKITIQNEDFLNFKKIFNINKNITYHKKIFNLENKKKGSYILYLQKKNKKIGMIRIISKKIIFNHKIYSVACVTSVGIFNEFVGKGYSKKLLKLSNFHIIKNFDLALLIARKKLDHFYPKFNFVGNSEFYKVKINSIKKKIKFKLRNIEKINKDIINLYNDTNKTKNGFFLRNKEDWKIIFLKIKYNKFSFKKIIFSNKLIGFVVYTKNQIIEYGYLKKFEEIFSEIIISNILKHKNIEILNPDSKIFEILKKKYEIEIYKRFCSYGGHMVNVYSNHQLKNLSYNINFLDQF